MFPLSSEDREWRESYFDKYIILIQFNNISWWITRYAAKILIIF